MQEITLTLTLSYSEATEVLTLINTLRNNNVEVPNTQKLPAKDQSPSVTKEKPVTHPTAGKTVKMPTFGRKQHQIDAFEESEKDRVNKKTEAQLLKEQKEEEKAALEAAQTKELEAIKSAPKPKKTDLPIKPWEL
jgi:hypothetical protein